MVAKKVRDSLPLRLRDLWELNSSSMDRSSCAKGSVNAAGSSVKLLDAEPTANLGYEHKENQTDFFPTLKELFLKAFKVIDKELKLHPYIDCFSSGTTAVTLVKQVSIDIHDNSFCVCVFWLTDGSCLFFGSNFYYSIIGAGSCYWKYWRLKGCFGYQR